MNKHTPGPWQLAHADANRCRVDIETVERGNDLPHQGNHIAVAYWGTPIEEANARLIAASPELLDLLKHAKQHLDSYRAYSAEMSKIGRGHVPSGPYSPEYLDGMIKAFFEQVGGV